MNTTLTNSEAMIVVTALAHYTKYLEQYAGDTPTGGQEWGRDIAVKITYDAALDLMVRLEDERKAERESE